VSASHAAWGGSDTVNGVVEAPDVTTLSDTGSAMLAIPLTVEAEAGADSTTTMAVIEPTATRAAVTSLAEAAIRLPRVRMDPRGARRCVTAWVLRMELLLG
jgi:hypothetical protein